MICKDCKCKEAPDWLGKGDQCLDCHKKERGVPLQDEDW